MKNFNSAFAPIFLLFFTVLVTACNNEPEAPSVLQLVSSNNQNYVSENRNVAGGTPVITGVYAQAPTNNVRLTKFTVTFNYDTTSTPKPAVVFLDSTLAPDTKTFAMQVAYTPRNLAHKEIWRFIITDSNGKTYLKEVRIKTTSSANPTNVITRESPFYTYKDVLLIRLKNPQNLLMDSSGLFGFASATGTSFPAYAIKQPAGDSLIDFTFNSTATQKPSLSLTEGNSLIKTTLDSAGFYGVVNIVGLQNSYPKNTIGVNKLENLKKGEVLAFKSVFNKIGLLRIKKVYRTLDSLAIDVKVEK